MRLLGKPVHLPFSGKKKGGSCCGPNLDVSGDLRRKLIIVGNPNVGKSLVFNKLTGAYVTVSNYPGTTVEVTRGKSRFGDEDYLVMDTPGMYSLMPITEEERAGRDILLNEKPDVVLHVADAKNLERMLPLTLQLIEAGLPTMLDLNMIDESEAAGIALDTVRLEKDLGIPVVATAAATDRGIKNLRKRIEEYVSSRCPAA